MIRKCLKVIGTVAAILVGVVAVYVIYLFTTYHRIADNLPLTVEQPAKKGTDVDALAIGTEYTALTYNIGFGAYTPDFSFFMDGGESSWAKSKESVLEICFDMLPQKVYGSLKVSSLTGKTAVTCGPLVYCAEEADNQHPPQPVAVLA